MRFDITLHVIKDEGEGQNEDTRFSLPTPKKGHSTDAAMAISDMLHEAAAVIGGIGSEPELVSHTLYNEDGTTEVLDADTARTRATAQLKKILTEQLADRLGQMGDETDLAKALKGRSES